MLMVYTPSGIFAGAYTILSHSSNIYDASISLPVSGRFGAAIKESQFLNAAPYPSVCVLLSLPTGS